MSCVLTLRVQHFTVCGMAKTHQETLEIFQGVRSDKIVIPAPKNNANAILAARRKQKI